jgi:hypothetical protein
MALFRPTLLGARTLDFERRKMRCDIARIKKTHLMGHRTRTSRKINFRQRARLGFC